VDHEVKKSFVVVVGTGPYPEPDEYILSFHPVTSEIQFSIFTPCTSVPISVSSLSF
jgi:hypothetical protein